MRKKEISAALVVEACLPEHVRNSDDQDAVPEAIMALRRVRLGSQAIEVLDGLECLGLNVENLYLENNRIRELENLEPVSATLKFLSISHNCIETVDVRCLSLCKRLEFLDLSHNAIAAEGPFADGAALEHSFARAVSLVSLRVLCIEANPFVDAVGRDACSDALARGFPALELLDGEDVFASDGEDPPAPDRDRSSTRGADGGAESGEDDDDEEDMAALRAVEERTRLHRERVGEGAGLDAGTAGSRGPAADPSSALLLDAAAEIDSLFAASRIGWGGNVQSGATRAEGSRQGGMGGAGEGGLGGQDGNSLEAVRARIEAESASVRARLAELDEAERAHAREMRSLVDTFSIVGTDEGDHDRGDDGQGEKGEERER